VDCIIGAEKAESLFCPPTFTPRLGLALNCTQPYTFRNLLDDDVVVSLLNGDGDGDV
jgi:hypothetical protein